MCTLSVVEHEHEIETKNKILDPCDPSLFDVTSGGANCGPTDNADKDCHSYTCVHTNGIPTCSTSTVAAENALCEVDPATAGIQEVCRSGVCVGKKIFIAFRIKHLNW